MTSLSQAVPDVKTLLALEAPELAGILLEMLNTGAPQMHRGNFTLESENNPPFRGYPAEQRPEIAKRVAEAWGWLEAHGMIAIQPGNSSNDNYFVTRLGRRAGSAKGLAEYRKALELPKDRLHPAIAERCFGHFVRGLFDTAVFEAYKALEVAIREASGLPATMLGVTLARKAFHPEDGPLTDKSYTPLKMQTATGDNGAERHDVPILPILACGACRRTDRVSVRNDPR
jgi:hypothetical protein